ncbi:MAG: SDR family NAD(P)-dependent oxidoreductase [Hyphomicrobiales bacterium]|nr:SDR family NAD(P)-dependent oxidoreductase [Hyphomicrobiales bacterium]
MDIDLKGKTVLITGASKGIGRVIAETMAAEGCHLHLAARDEGPMKELAAKLSSLHGITATVHRHDLGIASEVEALGHACADVDILVNNAGDIPPGTLAEIDSKTWREAWSVKVFGYIDLTRIVYARMCARRSGVIVNIIGAAARQPNHRYIAGCSANIALNMFTQCLGGESMRHGVRVVAINPGPTVPGRHLAHIKARARRLFGDENRWPELHAKFPAGRAGEASEVAELVVFLASERAKFLSGTAVDIDGGHSVYRPDS